MNKLFIITFGIIGIAALFGALFCNKEHQFFVAGFAFIIVLVLHAENRKIRMKLK